MTQPHASGFNAVAGALVEGERKALVDAMWAGGATIVDQISGTVVPVGPDRVPETGEALFYVGFLGSKRDGISTQHYMIPASDECTAITRAHELYEKLPKRRKGLQRFIPPGNARETTFKASLNQKISSNCFHPARWQQPP